MRHLAFATLLCVSAAAPSARAEEIKIELSSGQAAAVLAAPGARFTEGPEGQATAPGGRLQARGEVLLLDGRPVRSPLVVEPAPPARTLALDGRALPGRLEVWAEKGALVAVNALDLDEYVAAVVGSEMPAGWPAQALRAQAVAARTYAVAQKVSLGPGARAHLGASVLDQVYGRTAPTPAAVQAAQDTRGEVLTFRAAPIWAFFSASCGGKGESGEDAFGAPFAAEYLPAGSDGDADAANPRLRFRVTRTLSQIGKALQGAGMVGAKLTGLAVVERTPSGRAKTLVLRTRAGEKRLAAADLRKALGYGVLPSLLFEVKVSRGVATFTGRGSGHGAGLCQWGARGLASRGETYQQILARYYPGTELRRMY